jgi:hypothetical protein
MNDVRGGGEEGDFQVRIEGSWPVREVRCSAVRGEGKDATTQGRQNE